MITEFPIIVTAIQERIVEISREVTNPQRTHRFYGFRDESNDLPVIRIPIGLPIYRVANYRTNLLQMKWIREKGTSNTFFSVGEENESIQKIQHEFLWNLANSEKGSITSIIQALKTERQQEPILITTSGVVVNGNRRLSAMREIYREDQDTYSSFSHIDCMVLPNRATEDDLKDIEVRLQMTPETRLPYGWINELIAIKDLKNRGRSLDAIGSLMRLDGPRVKDKLLMLDEIDFYLKEWKIKEADYDRLNDAEEIISQVTNRLKRKEGAQKEIARRIGWILLDQRGKDGRVYELREATGTLTQAVVNEIQEVYPTEIVDEELEDEIPLEFDLDETEVQTIERGVITFLETCRQDEQLQEDIIVICRKVIESQKNQQVGTAALKAVQAAHTKLIEADLTNADRSTYEPIKRQLDAIEQRVINLKLELDRYLH